MSATSISGRFKQLATQRIGSPPPPTPVLEPHLLATSARAAMKATRGVGAPPGRISGERPAPRVVLREEKAPPPVSKTVVTPATKRASRQLLGERKAAAALSPVRFVAQAALVLVAAGAVIAFGHAARTGADAPSATVAPAATAAPAAPDEADDAAADEALEPTGAETPTLPAKSEVRWDPQLRALVVVDVYSREELPLGPADVSRVKDAGGATVTLELWGGRSSLEVPRAVYQQLPARDRYAMDYSASGNLREDDGR